jgi:hypothetical protein
MEHRWFSENENPPATVVVAAFQIARRRGEACRRLIEVLLAVGAAYRQLQVVEFPRHREPDRLPMAVHPVTVAANAGIGRRRDRVDSVVDA